MATPHKSKTGLWKIRVAFIDPQTGTWHQMQRSFRTKKAANIFNFEFQYYLERNGEIPDIKKLQESIESRWSK